MLAQLLPIFFNVLVPVLSLVVIGYAVGPRLKLDTRTISRLSYYVLIPAFVFDVLSQARMAAGLAARMIVYVVVVHLGCVLLAIIAARLLRRPQSVVSAYVLIAVFGNVGNFGVPLIQFALGEQALVATTVYFLGVVVLSFIVGLIAANWSKANWWRSLLTVLSTPALIALPPALLVNVAQIELPQILSRPISLMSSAAIPMMLLGLGVQLAHTGLPRITVDVAVSSGLRLLGGAILALLLAAPFGISGLERDVGIIQSSMPVAVLASIIAAENDLEPQLVNGAVLYSTLASIVTLTVIIALV